MVAERLGNTQTFVSKCERGERRIDVVDLVEFLDAVGRDPAVFVKALCRELSALKISAPRKTAARTGKTHPGK